MIIIIISPHNACSVIWGTRYYWVLSVSPLLAQDHWNGDERRTRDIGLYCMYLQGKGEMETFFLKGRQGRPMSSASGELDRQTPILNGLRSVAIQQQQPSVD